jgi:hypothetical protein
VSGTEPGSKLQSQTPEQYGDKYRDHLLEQYKLFVQTSQQVSERRQNANNFLLTLNSSLVTLFVISLSSFGHHRWNALIPFTGLFVCFIWHSLVESYKDLNTAKFEVIHELEDQLPVALFRYEWHVCGHGKDKDKHVPLTHLERWIPWMFAMLYVGMAAYALFAPVDRKEPKPQPSATVQLAPAPTVRPEHQACGSVVNSGSEQGFRLRVLRPVHRGRFDEKKQEQHGNWPAEALKRVETV